MTGLKTIAWMYVRSIWRRRWHALIVAWSICAIGWAYVIYLPNQYEAKTRIYVDTDSMLRPLMRGIAVDSNVLTQVDVMQRTLLSRPNLQMVSHMADLDLAATGPADAEEIVNQLRQRISVLADGRNLFSISYTGPNRDTATKVVQSLLTVFVESNLGNTRNDMLSARNFIDDQLRDYAKQLDLAEKRVAEFKGKNIGFLPGENNYNTKLDVARQDLEKAKADVEDATRQRAELVKQMAATPKFVDSFVILPGDVGAGPPLGGTADTGGNTAARIAELEQKLRALRENYTDEHPDVIRTQKLLDRARQEAADAAATAAPDVPVVDPRARKTTAPNPVYEQLELRRTALDASIASLQARVGRLQTEADKWQQLARSVPEVGAEMAKLTRDYDVIKKAYDELLSRRESAKIGSDLEAQTQTVQFRIVDPPEAPLAPVAPKRILLLSVVLIGGIAAGGAFAFLLVRVDDTISTLQQLKSIMAVPVLGAISATAETARKWRRGSERLAFAALCAALFAVFAVVVWIEASAVPVA
jgi:polysaccharide chain length determinant protein (PEP-CTERM system associated)